MTQQLPRCATLWGWDWDCWDPHHYLDREPFIESVTPLPHSRLCPLRGHRDLLPEGGLLHLCQWKESSSSPITHSPICLVCSFSCIIPRQSGKSVWFRVWQKRQYVIIGTWLCWGLWAEGRPSQMRFPKKEHAWSRQKSRNQTLISSSRAEQSWSRSSRAQELYVFISFSETQQDKTCDHALLCA